VIFEEMTAEKERRKKEREQSFVPFLLLATGLLILDQMTKTLIRLLPLGEQIEIIPGFFWLTHVTNTGASFSILTGKNGLLLWIAILFLGILIYNYDSFRTKVERIIFALLLAGVIGNLLDRIFFGAVTDLFDLGWFPVFNVADSCLVIGVFWLLGYELYKKQKKQ